MDLLQFIIRLPLQLLVAPDAKEVAEWFVNAPVEFQEIDFLGRMPGFRFDLLSSSPERLFAAAGDLNVNLASVFAAAHHVARKKID